MASGHWEYKRVYDPVLDAVVTIRIWVPDPVVPPPAPKPPPGAVADAADAAAAAAAARAAAKKAAEEAARRRQAEAAARAAAEAQAAAKKAAYEKLKAIQSAALRRAALIRANAGDRPAAVLSAEAAKRAAQERAKAIAVEPSMQQTLSRVGESSAPRISVPLTPAQTAKRSAWVSTTRRANWEAPTDPIDRAAYLVKVLDRLEAEGVTGKFDADELARTEEEFEKTAEVAVAKYNALSSEYLKLEKTGDLKAILGLLQSEESQKTISGYEYFMGTDALNQGAVTSFYSKYGAAYERQIELWSRALGDSLGAKREAIDLEIQQLERSSDPKDKAYAAQLREQVFASLKLGFRRVFSDDGKGNPTVSYVQRTPEEERAYRKAQQRMEMERLYAKAQASRTGAENFNVRIGAAEGVVKDPMTGGVFNREDVEAYQSSSNSFLALLRSRGVADVDLGTALGKLMTEMKDEESRQAVIRDIMDLWDKQNRDIFLHGGSSQPSNRGFSNPAMDRFNAARAAKERELYAFLGVEQPGILSMVFENPVVQGLVTGLSTTYGVIGAGIGRALPTLISGKPAQLVFAGDNFTLDDLPPEVQARIRAEAAKMANDADLATLLEDAGSPYSTRDAADFAMQHAAGEWLKKTPEGKAWANKNDLLVAAYGMVTTDSARNEPERQRLISGLEDMNRRFYQGDARSQVDWLATAGNEMFTPDSGAANLLSALLLDPLNVVPLKFTTYLSRARYAAEAGKPGLAGSTKLRSMTDFLRVNEETLALRKATGKLADLKKANGMTDDQLVTLFIERTQGIAVKSARQKAIAKVFVDAGVSMRGVDVKQLDSLIQASIKKYVDALPNVNLRTQQVKHEADLAAAEAAAKQEAAQHEADMLAEQVRQGRAEVDRKQAAEAAKVDLLKARDRQQDTLSKQITEARATADAEAATAARSAVTGTPGVSFDQTVNTIDYGDGSFAVHRVAAMLDGKEIGYVNYHPRGGANPVVNVFVEPQYRRKGLATRLYREMEQRFGIDIEDASRRLNEVRGGQTPDGAAFYAGRLAKRAARRSAAAKKGWETRRAKRAVLHPEVEAAAAAATPRPTTRWWEEPSVPPSSTSPQVRVRAPAADALDAINRQKLADEMGLPPEAIPLGNRPPLDVAVPKSVPGPEAPVRSTPDAIQDPKSSGWAHESEIRMHNLGSADPLVHDNQVDDVARTLAQRAERGYSAVGEHYEVDDFGVYWPIEQSSFRETVEYSQLVDIVRSTAPDSVTRAAFDRIKLEARRERNRYRVQLEDAGSSHYRASRLDAAERGGFPVTSRLNEAERVAADSYLSDRSTIRALRELVVFMLGLKKKGKLTDEEFMNRIETLRGFAYVDSAAYPYGQIQRNAAERDAAILVGESVLAFGVEHPRLLNTMYETFNAYGVEKLLADPKLSQSVKKWMKQVSDPRFLRGLSEDRFIGLMSEWNRLMTSVLAEPLVGKGTWAANGVRAWLMAGTLTFELFHRMRKSDIQKLERMSGWAETLLAGEKDNILARMWQVMEERAGLEWAKPYDAVEDAFVHAVGRESDTLMPNHMLGMIPSGYKAGRVPGRDFWGHRLRGLARSRSLHWKVAQPWWRREDFEKAMAELANGKYAQTNPDYGMASALIHYFAETVGTHFWNRNHEMQLFLGHAVNLTTDTLAVRVAVQDPKWIRQNETKVAFVTRIDALEKRVRAAEKPSDPATWTDAQRVAYESGNYREFSRLRGYTDAEIKEYEEYRSLLDGLTPDEIDRISTLSADGKAQVLDPAALYDIRSQPRFVTRSGSIVDALRDYLPEMDEEALAGLRAIAKRKPNAGRDPVWYEGMSVIRQAYDEAYWAGVVTHDNPAYHTLQLFVRLQSHHTREYIPFVEMYRLHMTGAGFGAPADDILKDIFAADIERINAGLWHRVYGAEAKGLHLARTSHVTGETYWALDAETKFWGNLGVLKTREELEALARQGKQFEEPKLRGLSAREIEEDALGLGDEALAHERDRVGRGYGPMVESSIDNLEGAIEEWTKTISTAVARRGAADAAKGLHRALRDAAVVRAREADLSVVQAASQVRGALRRFVNIVADGRELDAEVVEQLNRFFDKLFGPSGTEQRLVTISPNSTEVRFVPRPGSLIEKYPALRQMVEDIAASSGDNLFDSAVIRAWDPLFGESAQLIAARKLAKDGRLSPQRERRSEVLRKALDAVTPDGALGSERRATEAAVTARIEAAESPMDAVEAIPPVLTPAYDPRIATWEAELRVITGMTESQWFDWELSRAKMVFNRSKPGEAQRVLAQKRIRQIEAVREAERIARTRGTFVRPGERRAFGTRVVAAHGDEAGDLMAPRLVAPYVEGGDGAIVEQVRRLVRQLDEAEVDDEMSHVHGLSDEASPAYRDHEAEWETAIEADVVPRSFWKDFGGVPAGADEVRVIDLLADWEDFKLALGGDARLDVLYTRLLGWGNRRVRKVAGRNYDIAKYLDDRIARRGPHYDPAKFEFDNAAVTAAVRDAMGGSRGRKLELRWRRGRPQEGPVNPEKLDSALGAVLAKNRIARERGFDVHAYNEARKALKDAVSLKFRASRLSRQARALAKANGTDYQTEFLRLRKAEAVSEGKEHLRKMAEQEMYGVDPALVMREFISRYGEDKVLTRAPLKRSRYQMATMRAAVEHWSGQSYDDAAGMAAFLSSAGTLPPDALRSRGFFGDFMEGIGAWTRRTAEDFANSRVKSWSYEEEADWWWSNYRVVPRWADENVLRGNPMFLDPTEYYAFHRETGIFNRAFDAAPVTREDVKLGNEARGIKAKRDLSAERKYVQERWGDLVWDGHKLTAMPWLMTVDELRDFFGRHMVGTFADDLVQNEAELAEVVALIDEVMDPLWAKYMGGRTGDLLYTDIFDLSDAIMARLLQHPKWARRTRDMLLGDTIRRYGKFQRLMVFTHSAFLITNVVDATFVKGPWLRFATRNLRTSADALSPTARALTAEEFGFRSSLVGGLRGPQTSKQQLLTPRNTNALTRLATRGEGLAMLPASMAGRVEVSTKLRLAREMYDEVLAQGKAAGVSDELAHAWAVEHIAKRVNRFWPTVGDGEVEKLFNNLVPFASYMVKNQVLFISEAVAHPAILNWARRIGDYVEEQNRERWAQEHPKDVLSPREARLFELPWAPGVFFDFGVLTDASRGLRFLHDDKAKSLIDHGSRWLRLVSGTTLTLARAGLNALGMTDKVYYEPILDRNGFPTGRYRRVAMPFTEPWSGDAAGLASIFWGTDLAEEFGAADWDSTTLTKFALKLAFFGGFVQHDRNLGLNAYFWELKEQDFAAAQRFLYTREGGELRSWWAANAGDPEPLMDPTAAMRKLQNDANPWLHAQSPDFQKRVSEGYAAINAVRAKYDALLLDLTPGTAAYQKAKDDRRSSILALYGLYPELIEKEVATMSAADWSAQLQEWHVDELTNAYFAMPTPKRDDFATETAFQNALDDFYTDREVYLRTYPQVADRLMASRNEPERVWKETEREWAAVWERIADRGLRIDAAQAAGDYETVEALQLGQQLDYGLLAEDRAVAYLDPSEVGGPTGTLQRVKVLMDAATKQWLKDPVKYENDLFYGKGMKVIIETAKASGKFDPGVFVRELRKNPRLLEMYFEKNPGKREQWAANDAYINAMMHWGSLLKSKSYDAADRYWNSLDPWIRSRYYQKHPERRAQQVKNAEYLAYMGRFHAFFEKKDYAGAKAYFKSLPQWAQDKYYEKHPDRKVYDETLDHAIELQDYFAADDLNRVQFLNAHPEFKAWIATQVTDAEWRRQAVLIAYMSIKDPWLKKVFREKYPEVFSAEAKGEHKLKRVYASLARHPEMTPAFEKWVAAIWKSYAENLRLSGTRPKQVEMVRDGKRRRHVGRSARWVRLHEA